MVELSIPFLTLMIGVPLVAALATFLGGALVTRRVAITAACIDLGLAIAAFHEHSTNPSAVFRDPLDLLGLLQLDGLTAVLLIYVAVISLVALLIAPHTGLREALLRRNLFAQAVLVGLFATRNPWVMALLWSLTILPPLLELRSAGPASRSALRVFSIYMGLGAAAFIGGVALIQGYPSASLIGATLIAFALLVRKGITPFHSWMPEFFEHIPLGASTLFCAPQVSAYIAATLVLPTEPAAVLQIVGVASILTALYGSAMALVQSDARRAYGYFFMSQSALVMLGFGCLSLPGITGALIFWLSSGLSLTGLGLALWVLEARRGRLRVDRFQGGYERTPLLGATFVIFGIGTVGFPGTLGFIGQELLIDGAIKDFPSFSFAYILASALGGLAVMRMYFALFTGAPTRGFQLQNLHRREKLGFALLGALLLGFGIWPGLLVQRQADTARLLLDIRAATVPDLASPHAPTRPHP